jgi:glycosyltransferase involved in cell wall biosynthesis
MIVQKKKVVHFTSVHTCFDIRIYVKECRTLVTAGYEVVLIAPHDRDEVVDGVKIKATAKPKNRRERIVKTVLETYRIALRENAVLYHFHDAELIPVGIMLRLKGKKVVYDVHEDLPRQIMTKPWINPLFRRIISGCAQVVENLAVKVLDGVVAVTSTIAGRFPKEKTVLVHNYPILGELTAVDAVPYNQRPSLAIYIGGLTIIRGIKEIIEAVDLLPERLDSTLVLAGSITEKELETAISTAGQRVKYAGLLPRKDVAKLFGRSRIGLVLFHPAPNHINALPNKLFEYLSAGLPIIASNFSLWREIIEDIGCGLLVDPLNPREIADAIQWMLEHPVEAEAMGKRGQEAVYEQFNWDKECKKLLSFYERLLQD